jgi:putative membrane protein
MELTQNESRNLKIIAVLSVAIPVVVAILLFMPVRLDLGVDWVYMLPGLNAIVNSATAIALVLGLIFIRQKKIQYHKTAMLSAFGLGCVFLVSYVIYHASVESVKFGDLNNDGILNQAELAEIGIMRNVYLGILLSHIVLAAVVVPFVLLAFYYALSNRIEKHRKIVKITLPVWLYVSVTGVAVYLLISPYYPY